eukprot:EG_transcript_31161
MRPQQVVQELQLLRGQLPGEIHQELLDLRLANLSLEATVHRLQEELRTLRAQQEHQAATAAMPSHNPAPPASGSHTPEELQRMHQMYLQATQQLLPALLAPAPKKKKGKKLAKSKAAPMKDAVSIARLAIPRRK